MLSNIDVMGIMKLDEKKSKSLIICSACLFAAAVLLYFSPVTNPYKSLLPVAILAIFSLWLCPWQMTVALAFSAAGDHFGANGNFLAQMSCFAISHIWFIVFFALRYHRKVEHDGKLTAKAKGYVAIVLFCASTLLAAAFTLIIPGVPEGILRIGVSVYACLICTMLTLALLQRSTLFAIGAILFVFSDFILAWNLFVEPVPHSALLIMIPYYSAQMLLFVRSSSVRISKPLRLLRF